jgi:hypothetical protein
MIVVQVLNLQSRWRGVSDYCRLDALGVVVNVRLKMAFQAVASRGRWRPGLETGYGACLMASGLKPWTYATPQEFASSFQGHAPGKMTTSAHKGKITNSDSYAE